MLKKRIIPKFLLKGGRLVKGVGFFTRIREAGNPVSTAKVYNDYGADELIFLDIDPSSGSIEALGAIIARVSEEVFMPFSVGGGVRRLEDFSLLLRSGADKVCVTTAAVEEPGLVSAAARRFGSQCVVAGVDYALDEGGRPRVMLRGGTLPTGLDPLELALELERQGAGEILLTSIERDGAMSGYDLEMIEAASSRLTIPVIASSGAGSLDHCRQALDAGAQALAIGSMFVFTDHSPIKIRSHLSSRGYPVRASTSSRN